MLRNGYYDVVVLDIMMPVMDGLEVLKQMRAEGNTTPTIMLTAKTQVDDKVIGLDLGANDYVPKPFDARELVARVRAAARRRSGAATVVTYGDIRIEEAAVLLSTERGSLRIDPHEVQVVIALAHAGGSSVATGWLAEHVWNGDALPGAIELYARLINGKLEALGSVLRIKGSETDGWRLVRHDGDGTQA